MDWEVFGMGHFLRIGLLMIACGLFGCDIEPALPPGAPSVNAWLAENGGTLVADAVVRARCRRGDVFGERRRGDWITTWYLVECDVTAVERGSWTAGRLVFVAQDAWPTVESGIMVDKAPWPYRPGAELRFGLNSSSGRALIVQVETLTIPR
jgi:hypothetical protein